MKNILNLLNKNDIGEPPWDYYFLQNLDEKEYPKYLAKLFYLNTGEKLPLRHGVIDKLRCKTFNQKIQWIKLYGVTPLMRDCTDKVKVRDYVKEKIGEEYLKPVLQIIPNESQKTVRCHCEQVNNNSGLARQSGDISSDTLDLPLEKRNLGLPFSRQSGTEKAVVPRNDGEPNDVSTYFDKIDFDKLPNSFVIKTNHGCKWQYIIKNKEEYLKNKRLFDITKKQMTGWLEQDYSFWGGFEMQYHSIKPKIIIEEFLGNSKETAQEIEVYCFNGIPRIIKKVHNDIPNKLTMYDETFNCIDLKFHEKEFLVNVPIAPLTKQTFVLSKQLSQNICFVRVDWMIYKNKIYFNEMTFTSNSGLIKFNKKWNLKLGSLLNI